MTPHPPVGARRRRAAGRPDASRRPAPRAGFTLIEVLIVITIIGLLAGLLIPTLMNAKNQARIAATRSTIEALRGALENYQSRFGDYPPTSLAAFRASLPNDTNVGIESAVACLATTIGGRPFIEGFREELFGNTDKDRLERNPTRWYFGDSQLREILDDWGNPLVYFHARDYARPEAVSKYTIGGPKPQLCKPQRASVTAAYHSPYKYQIWSAGPDQKNQNGEPDDIASW